MKLNIDFIQGKNGRDKPYITDDRGERLPGIRKVDVFSKCNDATIVVITLIVNGKGVTLGRPKQQPIVEQLWI